MAQWNNSRKVRERIVVEGTLHLETPSHFGNGDVAGLTDIALLRDPLQGRALLTGSSIAGALRNYLCERELGYGRAEGKDGGTLAEKLFGFIDEREAELEKSVQSWLMIDDALGSAPQVELRDGVAIDARTRTAERGKLFDMELLQAGTEFPLRFELWLGDETNEDLVLALATALKGLETGEIGLGKRKRRGFGECAANPWRARRFKMDDKKDVVAWLQNDLSGAPIKDHIEDALGITLNGADARKRMTLDATFVLDGSLMIRSASGKADDPDTAHLKSKRNGKDAPILSGTSAAGAIRARAQRITNTLGLPDATELIEGMFGKGDTRGREKTREEWKPKGSRVLVREREIEDAPETELVQSRVKIDRFTGGAFPQALFQEQPLFGDGKTRVCIEMELRAAKEAKNFSREVGLLLLVLKDLWTGDLPLGGEASVGRGRLKGEAATLKCDGHAWVIKDKSGALEISGTLKNQKEAQEKLEEYVKALREVNG